MAANSLQNVRRLPKALTSSNAELPGRPSLDLARRRLTVEVNFSPRAAEYPASRERTLASDGVHLEVGHAVDISEQIRRLEANWNSRELALHTEDAVSPFTLA